MPSRSGPTRVGSSSTLWMARMMALLLLLSSSSSNSKSSARFLLLVAAQQCTVCADGSPADGTLPGGTDCSLIERNIQMTPAADPECAMVQLQGFMHCNCPTFPVANYCSLCPYGDDGNQSNNQTSSKYEPLAYADWPVPTLGGMPCREAEFLPIDDDSDAQCSMLADAAWFCGCPSSSGGGGDSGVPRGDCYLCGDSDDDNNSEAAVVPNKRPLPPPLDGKTCDQVDREGGLYYHSTAAAQASCPALLLGEELPAQFDYRRYCGCNGGSGSEVTPPADAVTCELCDGGGQVQNPDGRLQSKGGSLMTCAQLEVAVPFVTDADYCDTLIADHADLCCNPPQPTTERPAAAAAATPAPAAAVPTALTPTPSRAPTPTASMTSAAAGNAGGTATTGTTAMMMMAAVLGFVLDRL